MSISSTKWALATATTDKARGVDAMRKFLHGMALAYAIIVGLLIFWSWCAVLASLHETRELFTGPEWLLYVACLPASHVATSLFEWADSFSWRFGDVIALSALGLLQAAALYLLTKLVPRARSVKGLSSSSVECRPKATASFLA